VICDVLCRKMTMYYCEHYGLSSIMSKLELLFYVLLLYVLVYPVTPILEAPHPERQPKYGLYIYNLIYSSVNRGMYGLIFLD
jgi:hypothetical protein